MNMRVDTTWHHKEIFRIEHPLADNRGEVANFANQLASHSYVGRYRTIGSDNLATLDEEIFGRSGIRRDVGGRLGSNGNDLYNMLISQNVVTDVVATIDTLACPSTFQTAS